MCGIVGYLGPASAAPILLDGLRRLEYRGYDSAGLAVHERGTITIARAVGKLRNLEAHLREKPLTGSVGIGHTRWATHGRPTEVNAHPHVSGPIAVVHNGIIENHVALRKELVASGRTMASDTDTEIVAHLVHRATDAGRPLVAAVREALAQVRGAYAIAVLSANEPETIVVARHASPLVLGLGEGENFLASDVPALLPYTRDVVFLEDGELAVLTRDSVRIETREGVAVERAPRRIDWSPGMAEKDGYKHFMLKEIFEQPRALEDTLRGRLDRERGDAVGEELGLAGLDVTKFRRVVLLACGTSHHATIVGRYVLERLARIEAVTELASEFRGRDAVIGPDDLVIAVSQSGETIDTLVAAKEAKARGATVIAVANVLGSAIPRLADGTCYTHAGPEIGVASTKCFVAQLAAMVMLALYLGRRRGTLSEAEGVKLVDELLRIPQQVQETLHATRQLVQNLARRYVDARDVLFLGRGISYPIALEGALKLKEISYVHAEGYAAGEMKHGPIALIDARVPVFVLVPKDRNHERALSNLAEAKAREARVIAVATSGDAAAQEASDDFVEIPDVDESLSPFLTVLPLQLYAYYVADFKGTDVDQPRNLAKTVTVE